MAARSALRDTLNHAARMPVVAVNAALRDGHRVVAAAAADPFAGEVLWTDGRTAHVRIDGRDAPLAPTAASRLVDLNLDPPFPNAPGFRALALAWVATGQRAGHVTDGDHRDSVHFAAGAAICEAAGCAVTDVFGDPWGRGPTGLVAAADVATHATLLALAQP